MQIFWHLKNKKRNKGDKSKTHKGEKDDTTKKGDKLKDTEDGGERGEKPGDKADVNEAEVQEEGKDKAAAKPTRSVHIVELMNVS